MSIKKHLVMLMIGLSLLLLWVYVRPVVAPLPETAPLTLSALTSANIAKAAEPETFTMQPEAADTSGGLPPTTPHAQISAQTVMTTLTAISDAFIIERPPYEDNNTGGQSHVAAGRDGIVAADGGYRRRGLMTFDIAGNIPAGSTILTATLNVQVIAVPNAGTGAVDSYFLIHRVTTEWGEGNKSGMNGAAAGSGEVTWNSSKHPTNWTSAGGDFITNPLWSSFTTVAVSGVGSYDFNSFVQTVADVQSWLDTPSTNYGWLLRSFSENTVGTVRQFGSIEGGSPATLTIIYIPPADLEISKSASADSIEVGETLTYTVSVTNTGPGDATFITMTDSLPPEVTYNGASGSGWTCNEVSGTVTCTRASLTALTTAPDILIAVTVPTTTGTITNSAVVSAAENDLTTPNIDTISTTVIEPSINVYLPILIK